MITKTYMKINLHKTITLIIVRTLPPFHPIIRCIATLTFSALLSQKEQMR